MREFIPVRVTASAECENALQTKPDATKEANGDSLKHNIFVGSFVVFMLNLSDLSMTRPFISVTNQECVVAHIVQNNLVLEEDD